MVINIIKSISLGVLIAALALALHFSGPWRPGAPEGDITEEQKAIEATIGFYNRVLQDFFASDGAPAMIDSFPATKLQKHMIFRDIGFLRESNLVMVYDMASMEFVDITVSEDGQSAVAITFEEWNYMYRNRSEGGIKQEPKGLGHGYRYSLVRADGAWAVDDVHAIKVQYEPDRDEFFF